MSYAFTFDASACTGCKACQEACRDKNNLPGGVLWRWVIEVSGGEWQRMGSAWENSVFAYNLTLACNHCVHPKCAGVCPVDAFSVRPDGIVLIDSTKCMGCGYCGWACPYGAPQYIAEQGVMGKCNFCYDNLDAGLPPSCVAACPLRVLDFVAVEDAAPAPGYQALWQLPASAHPFPLPPYSRTEPHLEIKPHPAMTNPLEKQVANREEIQPLAAGKRQPTAGIAELPLVAFTLLAQMAAGIAVCTLALPSPPLPLLVSIGTLLGIGGLISFLHLGKKRNVWRAAFHLRKSWLSREVLVAGLFGTAWAVSMGLEGWRRASLTHWLMALLGLGLVFSMPQVYRLRAVPLWNTWRTPASFFLSAAVLGALGVNLAAPEPGWGAIACLALTAELGLALSAHPSPAGWAARLRLALLGLGVIGAVCMAMGVRLGIPVFGIALAGEVIGRWGFYAGREASRY
jgi:anaerobic dimethyl sulfoxide reductase subunit B (iron-sulfur subunit)